jgi:RNA polymerase sigma factor (sigma-70 family)
MPSQRRRDSMGELPDGELFARVAAGGRAGRRAQQALYQRHVRYLFGAVSKQRDKLVQLAGLSAEDLVQDTFQRAFDRASTFKHDPELEPERARRRTRAWLGRIAHNLLADAFRRFREVSASDYLDRFTVPAVDDTPASRPDLEPIRQAFAGLSDREQDVLRVTALYHKAEGSSRLPNAVSAELGKRWGITNQNVRAIRSRALKKLKRAMAAGAPVERTP